MEKEDLININNFVNYLTENIMTCKAGARYRILTNNDALRNSLVDYILKYLTRIDYDINVVTSLAQKLTTEIANNGHRHTDECFACTKDQIRKDMTKVLVEACHNKGGSPCLDMI